MELSTLTSTFADILKRFDEESPAEGDFLAGIGPFNEVNLVDRIADDLKNLGLKPTTNRRQSPDLDIGGEIAVEFKLARPYGNNGGLEDRWSVKLLYPYKGNKSLVSDAIKLSKLDGYSQKYLCAIGFEHDPPRTDLSPALQAFELIVRQIFEINISKMHEERRRGLIHPVHQVLRCCCWELQ